MARIDVDGIYKHSPMTEAQILAEKNDDREIVINTAQVTEAAPVSSSDTDRTKYNPSYTCETESGKVRRNVATLETLGLDGSQAANGICGADLIGINVTKSYGFIDSAGTVQEVIDELDTAMSGGTPGQILTSTQNGLEWKSGISTPGAFVEATNSTPLNLKGNDILTTANVNIINTADGYFSVSTDKTASGYASTLSLGTSGFLVNSSSYNTQSSSGPITISSSSMATFHSTGPLTVSSDGATATFQGAGPTNLQSTGGAPVTVKSNGSSSDHSDLVLTPNAGTLSVNASTADHTLSMYSKSVVNGNTSYAQIDLNDSSGVEIHTNASTIKFTSEGGAPITSTVTGDSTHYTTVTENVTGLSASVTGASSPLSFSMSGGSGQSSISMSAKSMSLVAATIPTDTGNATVAIGGPMIGTLLFNTTGVTLINPTLPTSVTTTELKLPAYNNAFDSTTTHKVMVHAASDGGVELAEMSDLTNEQFGLDDNTSSGTMLYVEQVADTVEPGDPQTYHPEVTKLAPGTTGQVLTVGSSGVPEWANGGSITNPVEELLVMNEGFQLDPFSEDSGTWTDVRYNETYTWKKFNGKVWMTQNFRSGGSTNWLNNATQQANQNPTLGKIYTIAEAQSLCPAGWRLPTKEEYDELIANETAQSLAATQTGSTAGEVGWTYTWGQTNDSGFNVYPTGYWRKYGAGTSSPDQWYERQTYARYWTSSIEGTETDHGNRYYTFHMGCGSNNGTPVLDTTTLAYEHQGSGTWDSVPVRIGVRYVYDYDTPVTVVKNVVETNGTDSAIVTEKAVRTELDKKANNVFTSKGCLAIGNDAGTQASKLAIGTQGQFLMVSSAGRPQWASLYLGTFTTANRPVSPIEGSFGVDLTLRCVVWYVQGVWINASGSAV